MKGITILLIMALLFSCTDKETQKSELQEITSKIYFGGEILTMDWGKGILCRSCR